MSGRDLVSVGRGENPFTTSYSCLYVRRESVIWCSSGASGSVSLVKTHLPPAHPLHRAAGAAAEGELLWHGLMPDALVWAKPV